MSQFITGLDARVLEYLFLHRDITTTLSFIGLTELGSTVFVCGIALCVCLLLVYRRASAPALGLAVSVLGGGATVLLIKEFVRRARPEVAFQAYRETGFSFPSGHATLAVALYGFLIYLAYRMMPAGNKRTALVTAFTVLIAVIIFSRLYLGVHYLSDVIGGLFLGGLFVWLGSAVVRKIESRN
ncbi:phosphatase PAP2 family protein [Candidatus Kaiserbacteria bacterium]|nr:phosphatase PAP2 family protein [Candidatus Kaiserbacteria bacterium]